MIILVGGGAVTVGSASYSFQKNGIVYKSDDKTVGIIGYLPNKDDLFYLSNEYYGYGSGAFEDTTFYRIGITKSGTPVFITNKDGSVYEIIHAGNINNYLNK